MTYENIIFVLQGGESVPESSLNVLHEVPREISKRAWRREAASLKSQLRAFNITSVMSSDKNPGTWTYCYVKSDFPYPSTRLLEKSCSWLANPGYKNNVQLTIRWIVQWKIGKSLRSNSQLLWVRARQPWQNHPEATSKKRRRKKNREREGIWIYLPFYFFTLETIHFYMLTNAFTFSLGSLCFEWAMNHTHQSSSEK